MLSNPNGPELEFQAHIADFLAKVHGYRVLQQAEITPFNHPTGCKEVRKPAGCKVWRVFYCPAQSREMH